MHHLSLLSLLSPLFSLFQPSSPGPGNANAPSFSQWRGVEGVGVGEEELQNKKVDNLEA